MSTETSVNLPGSKRKPRSPLENTPKVCRRRVLSSSLPDISKIDFELPSMDLPTSSNPCVTSETVNVPLANQQPTIEAQGKTYSLPQLIFGAIQSQNFMTQLVPVLTNAITPTLQSAIQSAFQNLTDTIENQSKQISTLSKLQKSLTKISKNKYGILKKQ